MAGMLAEHETSRKMFKTCGSWWPPGERREARCPTSVVEGRLARATGLALCILLLAACSSPGSETAGLHAGGRQRGSVSRSASATGTTTLSPRQQAVVVAWEDAERTLYGYMQEPPAPARAALVAGDTSAVVWPRLGEYFAGAALRAESLFLIGMTMQELHGPTSYDLGHPVVTVQSATTATVTGCIYDTGTTTPSGAPGPENLDGGGPGGYRGNWELQITSGSWKISAFETKSTSRC